MAAEQLFLKDDSRRCDTDTDPAFEKRYCDYSFCVKGLDQKAQNRYAWAQMIANCFLKNNIDRQVCIDLAKKDSIQPQNRWHDVLTVLPAKLTDVPAAYRQQKEFKITFTTGWSCQYEEYCLQFDHMDEKGKEVYKFAYEYSYEEPAGFRGGKYSMTHHIVAADISDESVFWIGGDEFDPDRFSDTFKDSMLQKLVNILFSDDEEDLSRIYITDW